MAWINLLIAGLLEITWAVSLGTTESFTQPLPTILVVSAIILSFLFLGRAMRTISVGTAYTIWVGIGAAGTAIFGMIFLGESTNVWRIFSLSIITMGIIGIKLFTSVPAAPEEY